jgi:shikimate kinase
MNIVLVGLMGTGKTTVGRILAATLGRPFVDTDAWVEARAGRPISAIFEWDGETAFRAMEEYAVEVIAEQDGQIIATGGGAVISPKNREALRRTGHVFWLDAPPDELVRRATADGVQTRPLLGGIDPLAKLTALAAGRAEAYVAAAHHRVATAGKGPDAVAREILDYIGALEGDNGNAAGEG